MNKETTATVINVSIATAYTAEETVDPDWIADETATNAAVEMSATPSTIHSMVMIRLLSVVRSPKPSTTPLVANKWRLLKRKI